MQAVLGQCRPLLEIGYIPAIIAMKHGENHGKIVLHYEILG